MSTSRSGLVALLVALPLALRGAVAVASAVALTLTLVGATPCRAQLDGRVWTHEELGIRLKIPEGYTQVPLQVDEKWILAKFLCDKTYLSKDRDWNHEHRPLLRVIAFTEKAKQSTGSEIVEEGDSTFIGIGAVPYQGYRDYVKRHRKGFFFSREDDGKVGGEACLDCEVVIDKSEPKLHLYSTVFRREAFEVAVEFEVLEDRKGQLASSCRDTIDSVRFFTPAKTANASTDGGSGGGELNSKLWTAFRSAWRKRSAEERLQLRLDVERARLEKVRSTTPADWNVSDSPGFLVVSHTDSRFAERLTEGAELFRAWCAEQFDCLSDDHVRRGVLRLCRDYDEWKAYHFDSSGSTGWSLLGDDHEVGTYRDGWNGTSGQDVAVMFPSILRAYLQEKDAHIVSYTPYWLTWAIDAYVGAAVVKGRKLEFRVDDWVRDESRNMTREGKLPKLRDLLAMDQDALEALMKTDRRTGYAAVQALRYVLGPGSREKVFKDFLANYFRAVIRVAEAHEDDWKAAEGKDAQTEEEEEEAAKARKDRSKLRKKQVQQEINAALFGTITDKQWEKFEKAFEAFVKAGK